jgi:hypothetical protein
VYISNYKEKGGGGGGGEKKKLVSLQINTVYSI